MLAEIWSPLNAIIGLAALGNYSPTNFFYALLVDCAGEEILEKNRTSTIATNGQPRETETLIRTSENPLCRGCLKAEKGVDGS